MRTAGEGRIGPAWNWAGRCRILVGDGESRPRPAGIDGALGSVRVSSSPGPGVAGKLVPGGNGRGSAR